MMLLACMIVSSYFGGMGLTLVFAPVFQWNYVLIFALIVFFIMLGIYEIGRKETEDVKTK